MKSMVPAIRVFRPSVEIRVISWMPDSPAVSLRQLSSRPAPSDVITPIPVTTTIGRPAWSVLAIANLLSRPLRRERDPRRADARYWSPRPAAAAHPSPARLLSHRPEQTDDRAATQWRPTRH